MSITGTSTIDYQAVLATMGVHLTQSEANKVAISYTDMTPMDRFLAETCQLEGQAGSRQVAPSSSSCRPTQGSKDGDSRG